ncbi:MAG: hypothetical protein ABIV13_01350 [Fimbriimonadales bacterium]
MVGLLVSVALLFPQFPQGPSAVELEAMKKLDFMVGNWEGVGWMMLPEGREVFKGTENVQKKLQGKALLIEGKFADTKDGRIVHETMAIVTYDEAKKKYVFQTYLFNRPGGVFDLNVKPNGFTWAIDVPNVTRADYDMNLVNGEWVEKGSVTLPNGQKHEFLEMRLKKKS